MSVSERPFFVSSTSGSFMSRQYLDLPQASPDSDTSCFSTPSSRSNSAMSSPQSSPTDRAPQPYLLVPNLHISDPSAGEIDLDSHPWMVATVIEDDDLTFGGKPLSAWYEEDRRRLSSSDPDEEERRGRQRERARVDSNHHHHHHHHPHHHQHQHLHKPQQQQHTKKTKETNQ